MKRVGMGVAAVLAMVTLTAVPGVRAQGGDAQSDATKPEFFTTRVEPIFQQNCNKCHAGLFHRGGLNMGTREGMLTGGHHGPAVVPGDPAKSLLLLLVKHEGPEDPGPMPPKKAKLSDADIATIEQWIKAGAIMPESK
ncbi:MAG: cytochrome C [Acidobacteriota bacterium]|nr:cytochrome C [Acidobacteriota bacterium]